MIKYCNECKHSQLRKEPYDMLKCFNPLVNVNDSYMLTSIKGSGYGSDCQTQRRNTVWFWHTKCGTQGKFWEKKSNIEKSVEL